jgi:hypothetical protein
MGKECKENGTMMGFKIRLSIVENGRLAII